MIFSKKSGLSLRSVVLLRANRRYQDPEAFARFYEAQKENYVGLQSEHEISGKVYHVTNYLDRSKEATAFDKIDELIDRNR